jgi:hypothetical protein
MDNQLNVSVTLPLDDPRARGVGAARGCARHNEASGDYILHGSVVRGRKPKNFLARPITRARYMY